MKEFNCNGLTLIFYQKENDEKFSFLIKDEEELTEQLLATVKTKRVKEKDIKYAVDGIFNLINNDLLIKKITKMEDSNPIIKLNELVQSQFKTSIKTEVLGKTGPDHMPTVYVQIILPDGRTYKASGRKKEIAKQKAAKMALAEIFNLVSK